MTARRELEGFERDHERHGRALAAAAERLGSERGRRRDAKRFLTAGKVALRALGGDAAVLRAVKRVEEETNRAWEEALATEGLGELRALLEEGFLEERRHRAWLATRLTTMRHAA